MEIAREAKLRSVVKIMDLSWDRCILGVMILISFGCEYRCSEDCVMMLLLFNALSFHA